MLEHKFFKEIYDPNHDDMVIEGGPVNYFDFEFE
jgi:homoserine trans-succinylase